MTGKHVGALWYPLAALAAEWSRAGRRLGHASTARCVVVGCYSMAFVALRTGAGNRPVCFRHYGLLDGSTAASE